MDTIVHVQPADQEDLHSSIDTDTSNMKNANTEDVYNKNEALETNGCDVAITIDNCENCDDEAQTTDVYQETDMLDSCHEDRIHAMRQKMCDVMKSIQQQHIAELFPILDSQETTEESEDSVICRICHIVGDEKLIAPCRCKGSTQFVHETCLLTWFKKSVKSHCELCHGNIPIKKTYKPLSEWKKWEDRPIPVIWFTIFFVGLCLNILSIYVNASDKCTSTACVIFYVVNGFGILLDSAFLYFWWIKCSIFWKKWLAVNQDWFIKDAKISNYPVIYKQNSKGNQESVQIIVATAKITQIVQVEEGQEEIIQV